MSVAALFAKAEEAKERIQDARKAGARPYRRDKFVRSLGEARQILAEHRQRIDFAVTGQGQPPSAWKVGRRVVYDTQIVLDAEDVLGIEFELAELTYRLAIAEAKLEQARLK